MDVAIRRVAFAPTKEAENSERSDEASPQPEGSDGQNGGVLGWSPDALGVDDPRQLPETAQHLRQLPLMNPMTPMSPPGRIRLRQAGVLVGLLSLLANVQAAAIKFIAVSATTVPGYARPVDADGKFKPQSYVFTEGKFFAGQNDDASLAQMKFGDILKTLAPNLARQNYFPTKDVASADIVIVVHWGTTTAYDDPQKQTMIDHLNESMTREGGNGQIDQGTLNQVLADQANALNGTTATVARNSALLGFQPEIEKEQKKLFASTSEQTMEAELNEERYFVILMAYDLQRMKKEHKSRVLWATRISVRSPGHNFTEAMPALVEAGAEVYGRQVDGLVRVNERSHEGHVNLGEMKVLGVVEKSKPGEKKK
jgi:hypothetical protein